MIGPEVPEKIQKLRAKRLGRAEDQEVAESSDDDFAGPKLDDFKDDGEESEEAAANERLRIARIEKLQKQDNTSGNQRDSKHDSWMSMRPEWAETSEHSSNPNPTKAKHIETQARSNKPSLMELHQENIRNHGLDEKSKVTYDPSENLNAEVRKEVFRKASTLNDRFTRGS